MIGVVYFWQLNVWFLNDWWQIAMLDAIIVGPLILYYWIRRALLGAAE